MSKEYFDAVKAIEAEKGIPAEYLYEKISAAIIVAAKHDYNGKDIVHCDIDPEKQKIKVYVRKNVVDEIEDEDTDLTLEQAQLIRKSAKVGGTVDIPLKTKNFGRIVAQTAKHVIRQGIREAERGQMIEEFKSKNQELITAKVDRIDPAGQLDIGFFYATEHSSDRDVSFTPLFSLAYYVLMNPNCPLADRKALHLADLKGQSVVSSGAFDSFLSACQGPSLEELAQVGVDCSKITPSFEGALIMITMGTAMSIVPCLDDAVIPGITKVPLLDYPPVTVEIAAMRHTPRLEVQSFIEIAKRKYSRSFPEQSQMDGIML